RRASGIARALCRIAHAPLSRRARSNGGGESHGQAPGAHCSATSAGGNQHAAPFEGPLAAMAGGTPRAKPVPVVGIPVAHSGAAVFEREWLTYRKIIDNNYSFHREVYGELHRILVDEAVQPFRFLDLACGDASVTVTALRGTRAAHYHGIDLSQAALDLART